MFDYISCNKVRLKEFLILLNNIEICFACSVRNTCNGFVVDLTLMDDPYPPENELNNIRKLL